MLRMEADKIWVEFQLHSLLAGDPGWFNKSVWIDPQALHSPIAVYLDNFSSLFLHIISAHPGDEWSSNLLVFWEQPQITGQGRGCGSPTPYAAPKTLLPPT